MRVEGPNKPKHDREQCLALADIKWNKAMRTFDDLTLLVDDGGRPLPEAVMEVLLAVGPRLQRHLPHPMRNHVLALVKMNLGILLVTKEDDLVALERGAALIGEGFW
jgi:hypothetical protein